MVCHIDAKIRAYNEDSTVIKQIVNLLHVLKQEAIPFAIVYDKITLNPYHQTFITFWHHCFPPFICFFSITCSFLCAKYIAYLHLYSEFRQGKNVCNAMLPKE